MVCQIRFIIALILTQMTPAGVGCSLSRAVYIIYHYCRASGMLLTAMSRAIIQAKLKIQVFSSNCIKDLRESKIRFGASRGICPEAL